MGLPVMTTHRRTDDRACGAETGTGMNQDNVFANNLLVASDGDGCTHGGGALIANADGVFVHGILVVGHAAGAGADGLCPTLLGAHCAPGTTEGSPDVFVGS